MAIDIESGLVFNSIFWLTSPRPDETNMVDSMIDDISVICVSKQIPFQKYVVPSGAMLIRALAEIEEAARRGLKPLIYLDMHGSPTEGIEIAASREMVPWDDVVDALRKINQQTGNNLLVVAAVCYGFHAIKETVITELTPFFVLIAPEKKILFGDLMDRIFPFFQNLATNLDVMKAFEEELSPKMKMFHCGRVFTIAMAKYIVRSCKGKGSLERREQLLTEVMKSGYPDTPDGLRTVRKAIKDGVKPTQQMLDRFAGKFLGGKPLGYDLDTLMRLIDEAAGKNG
jgi:hypothetical protein